MTPHPKRKHSKGRRDRRRSQDALTTANLVTCSNCGNKRLPHVVCSNCGYFKGREVYQVKKEKKSAE
ncbi:MAG: 50S ribosomal protein L32 [Anaerolineae bacterium]|jgi:large subunit ribosomal protein L32|nr:50S ribosomal protein L32 [Anaerolineae bacterium]